MRTNGTRSGAELAAKVGRNDPCPCGSGKKYKQCCQPKEAVSGLATAPSASLQQRRSELVDLGRRLMEAGRWQEAIPPLAEHARLAPQSAEAHRDLGAAYLRCSRYAEAAASLNRALAIRPAFELALRELLMALGPMERPEEARTVCLKLAKIVKDPGERRSFAAKALLKEKREAEAERELRQAIRLSPGHAETRLLLGHILMNNGAFEEAASHLEVAVPSFPSAFNLLATARRMTEADRPLLSRMSAAAEHRNLNPRERGALHFGLGKSFDDLGDYAQAIRYYDEGNRLRRSLERFDRAAIVEEFDRLIAETSAESLAPPGDGAGAPVFILGMPRSGTTLVEQILSSHPAVAGGGELPYWYEVRRAARRAGKTLAVSDELQKIADDYRALLKGVGGDALRVTDKTPKNFELIGWIRAALPDARIIHCRRNPVDTCLSNYFQDFWQSQPYSWDKGDIVFFYRQYERLMAHWRSVLTDRFTEIGYETLLHDREAETRRLIAFLGLAWDDACLAPERNVRKVETSSVWQARQPVYTTSIERWRRYEPWLGAFRDLM